MFLLRETDRSVTDICLDVGFISLGTFSRTFREIIGETPSDYRAGHGPMVAPNCVQLLAMRPLRRRRADGARAIEQFWRSARRQPLPSLNLVQIERRNKEKHAMITKLNVASIYVLDKEEALDFYVNKLGLEKGHGRQAGRLPLADGPRSRTTRASRSPSSSRARRSTTRRPPSSSAS